MRCGADVSRRSLLPERTPALQPDVRIFFRAALKLAGDKKRFRADYRPAVQ